MKKNMVIVALLASLVGSNSFAIIRRVVDGTLNTAGNVTRGTLNTAGDITTGRQTRQETAHRLQNNTEEYYSPLHNDREQASEDQREEEFSSAD